jgi:phosphoenolpyruvate-protein kinase (PTS system EI component)
LGIMVETPAAVLHAAALACEADFFSLGTNDLAQYVMASDRLHPRLAELTDVHQPAVLRAIALAARVGRAAGRAVAVCGEMAADPALAGVLAGLGVAELSMAPSRMAAVKQSLLTRSLEEWQALADRALACATSGEVRELMAAAHA